MATFYSNTANGYQIRLDVNVTGQNVAANTSNVSYAMYVTSTSAASFNSNTSGSLTVFTAVSVPTQTRALGFNSSILIASGSKNNIVHNGDGTKSIPISATFQTVNQTATWRCPPLSLSTSMALPTIVPPPPSTKGRRWDGSAFVTSSINKRWNGTAFVDFSIRKRWNGSAWEDISI